MYFKKLYKNSSSTQFFKYRSNLIERFSDFKVNTLESLLSVAVSSSLPSSISISARSENSFSSSITTTSSSVLSSSISFSIIEASKVFSPSSIILEINSWSSNSELASIISDKFSTVISSSELESEPEIKSLE